MLALTLSRFQTVFGEATSHTKKVSRWRLAPWLDAIVQQDVGVHFSEVWLTYSVRASSLLPIAELVNEHTGRHSNTYWRTLDRQYPALRVRVTNEMQLDLLVRALRVVREGDMTQDAVSSA
jgi:hypothetical protein